MLATQFTLKKSKGYDLVLKEGEMHQRAYYGVCVLDRKDNKPTRFGVVVSKKVSKGAVQRNRIKRAITEAVRHEITNIGNGKDVIFLVKSIALRKTTDDIMKNVRETITSLGLKK